MHVYIDISMSMSISISISIYVYIYMFHAFGAGCIPERLIAALAARFRPEELEELQEMLFR